jgi:hypothetical protein
MGWVWLATNDVFEVSPFFIRIESILSSKNLLLLFLSLVSYFYW